MVKVSESLRQVLAQLGPEDAEKLAQAIYGAQRRHPSMVHVPGVGLRKVA